MKVSNPAAYSNVAQLTTGVALGEPFRGLLFSALVSGNFALTITTIGGESKTVTLYFSDNSNLILPLAGSDVTATITGSGNKVYALI